MQVVEVVKCDLQIRQAVATENVHKLHHLRPSGLVLALGWPHSSGILLVCGSLEQAVVQQERQGLRTILCSPMMELLEENDQDVDVSERIKGSGVQFLSTSLIQLLDELVQHLLEVQFTFELFGFGILNTEV